MSASIRKPLFRKPLLGAGLVLVCLAAALLSEARPAAGKDQVPWKTVALGTVIEVVPEAGGSILVTAEAIGKGSHTGKTTTALRYRGHEATGPGGAPVLLLTGDATIDAANGDRLFIVFDIVERLGGSPSPFQGSLTVTGGTGRFVGATGEATVMGVDNNNNTFAYSTEGTLSSVGSNRKRGPIPPPATPENLQAPEGHVVLFRALGKGVQIYTCAASPGEPTRFVWTFKAPEADLLDAQGNKIGFHYAGPTWETNGGSTVVGTVLERSPSPDPNAIPWLLLQAKSNSGAGVFGSVTFIQRVDTTGGTAPAEGCDADHAGAEARVEYTAQYYFYGPER